MALKAAPTCSCGQLGTLNKQFDAYCCIACDKFLEGVCDTPGCAFCSGRPDKPSEPRRPPIPKSPT